MSYGLAPFGLQPFGLPPATDDAINRVLDILLDDNSPVLTDDDAGSIFGPLDGAAAAVDDSIIAVVDVPLEVMLEAEEEFGAIARPLEDAPASDDTIIEVIDSGDDDRGEIWSDDGAVAVPADDSDADRPPVMIDTAAIDELVDDGDQGGVAALPPDQPLDDRFNVIGAPELEIERDWDNDPAEGWVWGPRREDASFIPPAGGRPVHVFANAVRRHDFVNSDRSREFANAPRLTEFTIVRPAV
jgi:hypothetical protein